MEAIVVVIILTGILQLVALIMFFLIAQDISIIKKTITLMMPANGDRSMVGRYIAMADEEKYLGNKDKAHEYLLRAKYLCEMAVGEYSSFIISNHYLTKAMAIIEIDKKLRDL